MVTRKATHNFTRSSKLLSDIELSNRASSPFEGIKGALLGFLMLLASPFVIIWGLLSKDKGILKGDFSFKLGFDPLEDDQIPASLQKADIFPDKFEAKPSIDGLSELYISYDHAETVNGFYFISYDPNVPKQYLWFIATGTAELEKLTELEGYTWELSEDEGKLKMERIVGQKLEVINVLAS